MAKIGKKRHSTIDTINLNGEITQNKYEITNLFATFLQRILKME